MIPLEVAGIKSAVIHAMPNSELGSVNGLYDSLLLTG